MKIRVTYFGNKVKGLFVGGCVERGVGSSFYAQAHAHDNRNDAFYGWICVRGWKRVKSATFASLSDDAFELDLLAPNRLILHEIAHILASSRGHDDKWRRKMRAMGQPIGEQYRKKKRFLEMENSKK